MTSSLAGGYTTPTLIDLLLAEYRKGVAEFNEGQLPKDRRDAEAELQQAAHFIAFAKRWLGLHYVIETHPADRDVAVRFETNQVALVTGAAEACVQEAPSACRNTKFVAVTDLDTRRM